MAVKFIKMHGLGNDYVFLDAVIEPGLARRGDLGELARAVSDRHTGVGSDGLIVVAMPEAVGGAGSGVGEADIAMRIFNSDGSEAEMCGNGVRCVAKLAWEKLGIRETPLRVKTGRGVLEIGCATDDAGRVVSATVDMGPPILDEASVPFDASRAGEKRRAGDAWEYELDIGGGGGVRYWASAVSMGNPHAVIFVEASSGGRAEEMLRIGPTLEKHPAFPKRVNVHLVEVVDRARARMWTWERGAGATRACGTGACAVAVAGVLTGRMDRAVTLALPGGELAVRWDEGTGRVFKTGPATHVCEGVWREAGDRDACEAAMPTIRGEKVVLRQLAMGDADRIVALAGDKRIAEYTLLIPHPYEREHATGWIAMQERSWRSGEGLTLAVTDGATGELVGAVGLMIVERHKYAEIGYWIGVPYWGRGLATEAAKLLTGYGFRELGLNRVHAYYFPGNDASGRVMENVGMVREGLCLKDRMKNGRVLDSVLYAVTRERWAELWPEPGVQAGKKRSGRQSRPLERE